MNAAQAARIDRALTGVDLSPETFGIRATCRHCGEGRTFSTKVLDSVSLWDIADAMADHVAEHHANQAAS